MELELKTKMETEAGSELLAELTTFTAELEKREAAAVYAVPTEVISAVKRAKSLEKLLHDIFVQVSGSGGIHLHSIIRREFGIKSELMDRFEQWAAYSKEQFEEELHDAIDRTEIRAGNQGVFFAGTPSKWEAEEALELLRGIAHAAVKLQFKSSKEGSEHLVSILDRILQFYALPSTYPEGSEIQTRNLISGERLRTMSGGDEAMTDALKRFAKAWYQQSELTFLERREGYFSYEEVRHFLYALTEEQLEQLKGDYIRHIQVDFQQLKSKPDLHRANQLLRMLKTVVSWTLP